MWCPGWIDSFRFLLCLVLGVPGLDRISDLFHFLAAVVLDVQVRYVAV